MTLVPESSVIVTEIMSRMEGIMVRADGSNFNEMRIVYEVTEGQGSLGTSREPSPRLPEGNNPPTFL